MSTEAMNERIAEITSEMAPHNDNVATAKAELAASQAWLLDVPLDASIEDIQRHRAVVDYWPAKIAGLVDKRNRLAAEKSALQTELDFMARAH